uniref:ATP synthase F0 subunit 8 n=1 Tax=Panopea abrupta TaxID=134997 RepID=A0A343AXN9_9BIVA|nr:ATP synthase F0 subunit 8 [Panopea abrupta]YP_010715715.1 ATP synthase F0 subunit 8 [Panopea japonica]APU51887.1 ATP synthase F0 subunit 8 [Panopea abrupta]WDE73818.1 ATP synthase F0 subunit 8 [Panopea japonica]WDE73831.1 ATP synthase F0 subunit 8 [Panopea japonica]
MAQFSPIYWVVVCLGVWFIFMVVVSIIWWSGKRPYSF